MDSPPSYLTLSRLIAEIESGDYQFAIKTITNLIGRIDPPVIARCAQYNHCSIPTADILVATAFGKHQLLGANLYASIDYTKSVGEFMAFPQDQERCFDAFVTKRGIRLTVEELRTDRNKRRMFIEAYNGKAALPIIDKQVQRMKDTIDKFTSVVAL